MLRILRKSLTARKNPEIPVADIKTKTCGCALLRAEVINCGTAQTLEKATDIKFMKIFETKKLCAVTLNATQKSPIDTASLGKTYRTPQITYTLLIIFFVMFVIFLLLTLLEPSEL